MDTPFGQSTLNLNGDFGLQLRYREEAHRMEQGRAKKRHDIDPRAEERVRLLKAQNDLSLVGHLRLG